MQQPPERQVKKVKRRNLRIVVLGDSSVGKTSLINQYIQKTFTTSHKCTIGADVRTKTVVKNGQEVVLQIWDTAGLERFQALGSGHFRGSDACFLVFDIGRSESFGRLAYWRSEFLTQIGKSSKPLVVVVGNKIDLRLREVSSRAAESWCLENGEPAYFETSAKSAVGLEECFDYMIEEILNRNQEALERNVFNLSRLPPGNTGNLSCMSCLW